MVPVDFPDDEVPRPVQYNFGSGPFVGRDNRGNININAIDETTKKVLRKLSREAPALAQLLENALRDGVVSADAAYALEYAARNINQDVAKSLSIAGRNINEDVANSLQSAALSINDSLTRMESLSFDLGTSQPSEPADLTKNLNKSIEHIKAHVDRVIMASQARPPADWRPIFYVFFTGLAIGMILIGIFWSKS